MSKEDYVSLHTLLAKLKYELEIELLESTEEYANEIRGHIEAINDVMKVFIMECD